MAANLSSTPQNATDAVLVESVEMPEDTPRVRGYDFSNGVDYEAILGSYINSGFQATNFGLAVEEINKMVRTRLWRRWL